MKHICELKDEDAPKTAWQKYRKILLSLILVSASNPLHLSYFKSDFSIRLEQERHLKINKYVIHPFSQFRGMYEVYLVVMYILALIFKPMTTFFKVNEVETNLLVDVYSYTIILGVLCWVDIIMTFFTGYVDHGHDMDTIELRLSKIAKHYITGPYFICDILSSVPKAIFFKFNFIYENDYPAYVFSGIMDILAFTKVIRIIPLFVYIYRSMQYLDIKFKVGPFLTCVILTAWMTIHWTACLQYGIPKLSSYFWYSGQLGNAWIYQPYIYKKTIAEKYIHCFFRTSAYILSIEQPLYGEMLIEEYIFAIITYVVGKILIGFVWLLLAMAILNSRSVDVKFHELKNQLNEYMWRKKLPFTLRKKISRYYDFKFQNKYFKEGFIKDSLSDNIKKEVTMHVCKTMIDEVKIFSDLSYGEISVIVDCLIPEIFQSNDVIIQHGTVGDAMYFLFSGTVAVYTRSGREICHLQEGSYFGEVCLLIPELTRAISIVAIETTVVYVLKQKDFAKHIAKNTKLVYKMFVTAEVKLKMAKNAEEMYKKLEACAFIPRYDIG